ncbi:MAG: cytochrome c oxidase subunit II [Candidatus Acidiferrales bacterium]
MWTDFPLFPEQASTFAKSVDNLYFVLVGVSFFFTVLIFTLVFYFAVKYRRRSEMDVPKPTAEGAIVLEIGWSVLPLIIVMIMFGWGAALFFRMNSPPARAVRVDVVGKQWMWKIQHPNGRREINELHVPLGEPVKLNMISEDVIHSFYIPAFRVKQDVLPGRYTSLWFEATKAGRYHLFCAEYCGAKHSGMIGSVVVMEPAEFEQWLGGGPAGQSPEQAGETLFQTLFCDTCHRPGGRGPMLEGVFGQPAALTTGQRVTVDEAYIRESILNPQAKVVLGYQPVMPTFQGQVTEEQILQLIAYIKSLTPQPQQAAPRQAPM